MQRKRAVELGGAVVEVAFEGGAIELGEIGHEGEGAVALQPAELGVQGAVAAAVTRGQTAPVRSAKVCCLLRGNVLAGKPGIEHLADQPNLVLGQNGDQRQRIGVVVAMTGGRVDLGQLLLIHQRVMTGKKS